MGNTQNFKEVVFPFVSYFLSIINNDDYCVIYDKWVECDDKIDVLTSVLGENIDNTIREQTPLKILQDYHKYFKLKKYILDNDLQSYHLQEMFIELFALRDICVKNTVILNLYYNKSFLE